MNTTSPQRVKLLVNTAITCWATSAKFQIERMLNDASTLKHALHRAESDDSLPYYQIEIGGVGSSADRRWVQDEYTNAGWQMVTCSWSDTEYTTTFYLFFEP